MGDITTVVKGNGIGMPPVSQAVIPNVQNQTVCQEIKQVGRMFKRIQYSSGCGRDYYKVATVQVGSVNIVVNLNSTARGAVLVV